jgi:hypothetical protein
MATAEAGIHRPIIEWWPSQSDRHPKIYWEEGISAINCAKASSMQSRQYHQRSLNAWKASGI